jgi:hypothetical protein
MSTKIKIFGDYGDQEETRHKKTTHQEDTIKTTHHVNLIPDFGLILVGIKQEWRLPAVHTEQPMADMIT